MPEPSRVDRRVAPNTSGSYDERDRPEASAPGDKSSSEKGDFGELVDPAEGLCSIAERSDYRTGGMSNIESEPAAASAIERTASTPVSEFRFRVASLRARGIVLLASRRPQVACLFRPFDATNDID